MGGYEAKNEAQNPSGSLQTDDLSCQKSQNAYETGGGLREKEERGRRFRRKKRKYILKK